MRWRLFLRQKNQASNTVFRNNEKSLITKTFIFFLHFAVGPIFGEL